MKIRREHAKRVLEVVDAGLSHGLGQPLPGRMCVEAAVCYALGLPHGDDPGCVAPAIRALKICLNDADWPSSATRAKGLRRLAVAQLGSKYVLKEKEFAHRVVDLAIRKYVPLAIRTIASVHPIEVYRTELEATALKYETGVTNEFQYAHGVICAIARVTIGDTIDNATRVADGAVAMANDAFFYITNNRTDEAVYSATRAVIKTSEVIQHLGNPTWDSVSVLSEFAEEVVQILIDMKAPGTEWLDLTE